MRRGRGVTRSDEFDVGAAYSAHGPELYRFALRQLGDGGAAQDVVQEVFLRAWRAAGSFDPQLGSLRTWLFAIARNVVVDEVRRLAVRPWQAQLTEPRADQLPAGSGIDEQLVDAWVVEEALRRIGADHRTAIVQTHLRGRPHDEVAAELGIPVGTLRSRVFYGLKSLRLAMEEMGWNREGASADDHRELREQVGVYALGHGTSAERAAVQAHLDGCAACRAELAELVPLRERLSGVDPDRLDDVPPVPPGLGDAVLARIAAEGRIRPALPLHRRGATLAAAAVLGIAAAAFGAGWLARPVPDPVPLEAVPVEIADADIAATADLVAHTWGVEVKLSGEGFTAGEVYRVTVTDEDGDSVPAGEFLGVGPAQLDCNLNSSVLREDAAGFTVLDAGGEVVLVSRF